MINNQLQSPLVEQTNNIHLFACKLNFKLFVTQKCNKKKWTKNKRKK